MPSYNYFVKDQPAPAPDPGRSVLVEIDAGYVGIIVSAIEGRKPRSFWSSDADYEVGRAALTNIQEALLMGVSDITPALNRVYMAIRQLSTGEVFTLQGDGSQPELPLVPPALPTDTAPGMLAILRDAQGVIPDGWFGLSSRFANLTDVTKALRAGEPTELDTLLDKIDLLGDASDITSIYRAVKGTATDLAGLAEGGGTLATLVVATMAQAATAGLAAGQMDTLLTRVDTLLTKLDRLIASTDGGAEERPAGNLLTVAEEARDLLTP